MKPSSKELAKALNLSLAYTYAQIRKGMPTDSIESAMAWRDGLEDGRGLKAPKPKVHDLDDGSLADTIDQHRNLVTRARGVWEAAMEGGDTHQGKYQTAYNHSLKTLLALEEEAERRSLQARDHIKAEDSKSAMIQLMGEVLAKLDKMPVEAGEKANPNDPPVAIAALQEWVRAARTDLSAAMEDATK